MILDENLFEIDEAVKAGEVRGEYKKRYSPKLSYNKIYDALEDLGYRVRSSNKEDNALMVSKKFEKNLQKAKNYCDEVGLKYNQRFSDIQKRFYLDIELPDGLRESFNDSPVARERTVDELNELIADYTKEVKYNLDKGDEKEAAWYQKQIDWAKEELAKKDNLDEGFAIIRTIEDAQREVDEQIEKFGRIGGGLYDDLDDAGFYVDVNNKVQYKVKPENESLKENKTYKFFRDYNLLNNLNIQASSNSDDIIELKFNSDDEAIKYAKDNDYTSVAYAQDEPETIWVRQGLKEDWRLIDKIDNVKIKVNLSDNGFYLFDETSEDENDYIDGGYKTYREAEDAAKKLKKELKEGLSPEQEKEYGLTTMINSLIKDELEAIDGYNSAIVNLEAENKGEFTNVIRDIINEENKHIGQLQAILKELNPSTTTNIDEGQQEGQEQIDQAVGVTKSDTEETTTTIDTEEGVIKTYKLDKVEDMKESLDSQQGEWLCQHWPNDETDKAQLDRKLRYLNLKKKLNSEDALITGDVENIKKFMKWLGLTDNRFKEIKSNR